MQTDLDSKNAERKGDGVRKFGDVSTLFSPLVRLDLDPKMQNGKAMESGNLEIMFQHWFHLALAL